MLLLWHLLGLEGALDELRQLGDGRVQSLMRAKGGLQFTQMLHGHRPSLNLAVVLSVGDGLARGDHVHIVRRHHLMV